MIVHICLLIIAAHADPLSKHLRPVAAVSLHACSTVRNTALDGWLHVVWKHNMGLMHCACICEAQAIHSRYPCAQDMLE